MKYSRWCCSSCLSDFCRTERILFFQDPCFWRFEQGFGGFVCKWYPSRWTCVFLLIIMCQFRLCSGSIRIRDAWFGWTPQYHLFYRSFYRFLDTDNWTRNQSVSVYFDSRTYFERNFDSRTCFLLYFDSRTRFVGWFDSRTSFLLYSDSRTSFSLYSDSRSYSW